METENTALETTEQAEVIEQQAEQTEVESVEAQPQATIKLNYLGEEKEIDLEEAKTLAQKGMDYDRQKERWETLKPTIDEMKDLAKDFGFVDNDGHGDYKAYLQAVKEAKRADEIEQLTQQSALPKELAEELYLSRQERQQREIEKQQIAERQQIEQENLDFLNYFKEVNGKPFEETDNIPQEVILANQKGIPLKYAYAEYLSKQLLSDKKIEETNQSNAASSTGSVNGQGASVEKEFFTSDEVDKLTDADYERNPKLWDIVRKSMLKW